MQAELIGEKGDSGRPTCANCRKSDSECVRGYSVRFRHGLNPSVRSGKALETAKRDFNFAHDQPWVKTNRALSFVDETPDVINIHDAGASNFDNVDLENTGLTLSDDIRQPSPQVYPTGFASSPSSLQSQPTSEPIRAGSETAILVRDDERPRKKRTLSHHSYSTTGSFRAAPQTIPRRLQTPSLSSRSVDESSFSTYSEPSGLGHEVLFDIPSEHVSPELEAPQVEDEPTPGDNVAETLSGIYLESPKWPMERQEAMLLRYFAESLAPFFDLCDNDRHFATVVPRRAAICPPLMNAVLAASAKRLSRIGDFDPLVVDRYHQNCLDALIPALSSSVAVMDENLLTAIVILRYMEELDVPIASTTSESHLVGTRVFVAAQEKLHNFTGLRLAAFWVALRQEIHMAFIQARPVHPNFALENVSRFVRPDDNGCSFANMTVVHCASCVRYCYGADEQSIGAWERLKESQDRWWAARPWSFHPMYTDNLENGFFPEELYLNDAVVTGVQHYHLAQVLMAAHNPKAPKLGPGQALAFRQTNEEIKRTVRLICGIAESNPRTAPAYVNACIAITMAGDRFADPHEQEALYNILVKTDTELAWPTRSAQLHLKEAWGWTESPANTGMPIAGMLNSSMQVM
ncbi:Fc.00g039470.m01.CDS01 [Cosmosporella sp. VM-42]